MFKKFIAFIKGALNPAKSRKSLVNTSVRKELSGKGKSASRRRKKGTGQPAAPSAPAEKKNSGNTAPKKSAAPGKNSSSAGRGKQKKTPAAPQPPPPMPDLIEIEPAEGKTRFCDLDLAREVLVGTQQLGFKYCSVIQAKCLPYALAGRDLAAKAQTGTGKTAAFLASSMTRLLRSPQPERKPKTCRVLVLEPTRELAMQIEKDARELGRYTGLYCKAIFGGMDYKEQREAIQKPVDILAGTPGRILDYAGSGALDLSQTEILVIDEADRMLDMGFIPDVRRIVAKLPPAGKRQTMLFSATLEPEILRLVERWLVDPVSVEAEPEHVVTDLIDQHFFAVSGDQKLACLLWLLRTEPIERMIIFGNWKHKNAELAEQLISYGIDCEVLSGDIAQNKRIRILDRFKRGDCKVVVATDVAARGIHVDGISHVVNYDVPEQAEDYVHRIGRTGRAGKKGKAITFVCEFGAYYLPAIEEYAGIHAVTLQPEEEALVLPERVKALRHAEHTPRRSGDRRSGGRGHSRRR